MDHRSPQPGDLWRRYTLEINMATQREFDGQGGMDVGVGFDAVDVGGIGAVDIEMAYTYEARVADLHDVADAI